MVDFVRIVNGDDFDNQVKIDRGGALITMDSVHKHIHDGELYSADFNDASLANAASIELLVVVTAVTHIRVSGAGGGDSNLLLFEGTTTSADGAAVTAINRNRVSSNTATAVLTTAPTITGDGTELMNIFLPGGSHGNAAGGLRSIFGEFILPAGKYLVRLTNNSGGAVRAHVQVDFYETS